MSVLAAPRTRRVLIWSVALLAGATALAIAAAVLGPRALGLQSFVVLQGSMEPAIHTGAIAIDEPIAAEAIRVGDVITFARPDGSYVTHRVVRIESDGPQPVFVTKGDANAVEDSSRVPAVGVGSRYRTSIPLVGYAVAELGQPWLRLAFLLAGVVLALHLLVDAVREMGETRKENARAMP